MDSFATCFAFTLRFEGNFTDSQADPGNWTSGEVGHGELRGTKYGISAASYPTLDIANITLQAAENIYHQDFWGPINGDALPLPVALASFDAAVNSGVRRAVIWLQQAVGVQTDGDLGKITLAAILHGNPLQISQETISRRLEFLTKLPEWANFGFGWSRRIVALAGAITESSI